MEVLGVSTTRISGLECLSCEDIVSAIYSRPLLFGLVSRLLLGHDLEFASLFFGPWHELVYVWSKFVW